MHAGLIAARLDRLPMSRTLWTRVLLLSLGGFFEFYDLLFTGYIAPGLVASGILTPTTPGLFGTTGIAGFVAAFFSGLFVGTMLFSVAADRLGRRTIFTLSLLWYTVASVIMAFQTDAFGLNLWRFISASASASSSSPSIPISPSSFPNRSAAAPSRSTKRFSSARCPWSRSSPGSWCP